ncbi:MAG: DUF2178 domain-containing protein [Syntrophomonadaceae bacterium]|jgi:uncharacterized membrane protein
MTTKQMALLKYLILAFTGVIAIWQILSGNYPFGTGLLAGIIIAGTGLGIRSRQINKMVDRGMNPYDERVWTIAGKASYASIRVFAIISAIIVLTGSIWGPETLVNPYNLLGICLALLMLLYVVFYYYYNHRM